MNRSEERFLSDVGDSGRSPGLTPGRAGLQVAA